MAQYKSEIQVMKDLGIETWRNLSREKALRLASMVPDMDKEVALKIIEQLPEFAKFALDVLDAMEKRHESTLKHNDLSQQRVHAAYAEVRQILRGELEGALTPEQRTQIYGLLMETADKESAKDTENKRFLDSQLVKVLGMGALAVAAAIVWVGGKALIDGEGTDQVV